RSTPIPEVSPTPWHLQNPSRPTLRALTPTSLAGVCQAAISKPILWVSFSSNVLTDIYLIMIPLPMLWRSSLRPVKKIASTIVLGAGIFVLVCATLKSVFVLVVRIPTPALSSRHPPWLTMPEPNILPGPDQRRTARGDVGH